MKKNNLIILIAVTIAISIAAIVASNMKDSAVSNQEAGLVLFPKLINTINDVYEVEINKGKNVINIQRKDNSWNVLQKDSYPANLSKVKETILKIAEFTTVEAKTKRSDNYGKLNVEDPKSENAKSILVTLKDKNNTVLASLIIGRQLSGSITAVGGEKTYVRKMDEDQVWLAKGGLLLDDLAIDWLDEQIIDIPESRISKVTITPAEGKPVTIVKNKPEDQQFTLLELPKNKQIKSPAELAQTARLLQGLRMKDVAKMGSVDMSTNPNIKTEVQTFDGLVITAVNMQMDNNHYITMDARFDAGARYTAPVPEPATSAATTDKTSENNVPPPATSKPVALKEITAVQTEAKKLNDLLTPWVFTLSKAKGLNFIKSINDLTKDKE